MELTQYIYIFRRWAWLLLLTTFISASVAFVVRSRQDPLYQAEVTLFVGGFIQDPNPGSGEITVGEQLAQTYAALATTYSISQSAVEAGNLPVSPGELRSRITTRIVPETSLLVIAVTYTDPVITADMANQVALQLIENSPSSLTEDEEGQLNLLTQQLAIVQSQLSDTQQELNDINEQLQTEEDIEDIVRLNTRRDTLIDRVTQASSTVAELTTSIQNIQRGSNRLEIVEPARIPENTTGLNNWRSSLIAAAVGLVIGIGIVLLIEYLNDTYRMPEEISATLGVPVLGTIFRFGKSNEPYPKRLITHLFPTSPISEGYRALRTNLMYIASEDGSTKHQTFIVTSPGPEEGKSVTIANLAVTMATAGMRVLLIDADLRRPKQHQIFDLENEVGLTTLLFANPEGFSEEETFARLEQCVQPTSISRLSVITSGFLPSNPSEILGSPSLRIWHKRILESGNIDIILYDTPPTLVVADSNILAATIDAPVLLIVRAGQTRRSATQRVIEQLDNLKLEIVGIAMNAVNPSDRAYGYGDTYYYYYAEGDKPAGSGTGWRRLLSIFYRRK